MAGLFIKLDTNFWSHPKVIAAGEQAAVLYQQMAMYCMDHATDGLVPDGQLPRFGMPRLRQRLDRLAATGLAEQVDGGWLLPGYIERYKTAAEVADLREKRRKAGQQGGRPRKQPEESPCLDGAKANGNQVAFTAPNPEEEEEEEEEVAKEPPPQVTPVLAGADPAVVVANGLMGVLGYRTMPAPVDLERYAGRALARGITPGQLSDWAADVAAMPPEQIETTALQVFIGLLRKRTNEPVDALRSAPAATERRGLLDDQRRPCANPDCVGGMVGGIGDDGRPEAVHPCPDCHVLGATA